MSQPSLKPSQDVRPDRQGAVLLMGLVALAAVIRLRLSAETAWWVIAESMVILGSLAVVIRLRHCLDHSSAVIVPVRAAGWNLRASAAQVSILLIALAMGLPLIGRWLGPAMGAAPAPWELVGLSLLAVLGLVLVAASRPRRHGLAVVCSGFLTLFTTVSSDHGQAFWFAATWAVICIGWLVAKHWDRLDVHLAHEVQYQRALQIGPIGLALAILLIVGGMVWQQETVVRIRAGIMPTSGGQGGADDAARSGVGDGDALIAARDHAASFGAVESELFMESDQPSLFDMFNDQLGDVPIRKTVERSLALMNRKVQENHGHAAESHRNDGSFSIARDPNPQRSQRHLPSARSMAILQWVGPTGERLAVERFDRFDGVDWFQRPRADAAPAAPSGSSTGLVRQEIGDRVWYFLPHCLQPSAASALTAAQSPPLVTAVRSDAVKLLNWKSPRVPAPDLAAGVHIADIDQDDIFRRTDDDTVEMAGRSSIPSYTVARLVCWQWSEPAVIQWQQWPTADRNLLIGSLGDDIQPSVALARAQRITEQLSADTPRGWAQIDRVLQHLRTEYRLERTATVDGNDPLNDFWETRRGGQQLFATAAAMLLHQLDYRVRLVTGLYADPDKQLGWGGPTEVLASDAHVWLEVQVAPDLWMALEPSPGYRPTRLVRGFASQAIAVGWRVGVGALGVLVSGWLLLRLRIWWGEWLCRLMWWGGRWLPIAQRVRLLARILDWRGRLAGLPRPLGVTQRRWLQAIGARPDTGQRCGDNQPWDCEPFFAAADRLFYGVGGMCDLAVLPASADRLATQLTAQRLVRSKYGNKR